MSLSNVLVGTREQESKVEARLFSGVDYAGSLPPTGYNNRTTSVVLA